MMTGEMAKENIDISIPLLAMIDSQVKLFEGEYSPELLFNMDIPLKKALVKARLANIKESQERLKSKQQLDEFSNDAANKGAKNFMASLKGS